MEVTNENARKMWCPFVRISTGSAVVMSTRTVSAHCLGTGCMAWIKTRSNSMGRCGLTKEEV